MSHATRFPALLAALSAAQLCACSGESPAEPGGSSAGGAPASGGSGGSGGGGTAGGPVLSLDGGTGDGSLGDAGCATASVQSQLTPANVLFLVDRSGTMACNPPPAQTSADCEATPVPLDASQPTKWDVIRAALKDAFAALPPTATAAITYFSNDEVCGVQSTPNVPLAPVDATQIAALGASLDAITPKGGTPTVGATILGYKYLHQVAKPAGNRFVVLFNDGVDNCTPDEVQRLVDIEAPKAVAVGIRTFVIGTPGSEGARAVLSQLAWAGGTARSASCDHSGAAIDQGDCHHDMTSSTDFAADLADALAAIGGQTLACELGIPASPDGAPIDYGRVNVTYTPGDGSPPQPILQDTTAACDGGANGWQYDEARTKILICGAICDTVQNDAAAKVDVVFGCETQVVK